MATVAWKKLVGQERTKQTLGKAAESGTLGHAYLFCGEAGVGKFQAALELGLALLCERDDTVPCYTCQSCRQVLHHAHPDFQLVVPVCLAKEHKSKDGKLTQKGWEFLDRECKKRIDDPYALDAPAGIATMPVEWIREVNHSILRGSLSGRRNVAVMCGIDLMNKESANAMLHTLEEPPANTVIVLTTERPYAVLPTIVSRCQIVRFGYVPDDDMTEALRKRYASSRGDVSVANAVRCAEGSLGMARRLLDNPFDELLRDAGALLEMCGENDWESVAPRLEGLVRERLSLGRDYGLAEKVLTYLIYMVRDGFLESLGASRKYIRNDFASRVVSDARLAARAAAEVLDTCGDAVAAVRARGNVQLVLVTFLMSMMEIIHGKEQPAR